MKVVYSLIATAMLVTQINASTKAQSHKDCERFLPENDKYIGVDQQSNLGGLDEAQFNAVIDEVEAIYKPIVAAKGGTLNVKRLWTDGTVNASAQRQGSTYVVNMYGGLARHQAVTADGFALVVCHEIGHHIGGSPVYGGKPSQANGSGGWGGGGGGGSNSWASNEGQSDYFANTKCLRKVFRN